MSYYEKQSAFWWTRNLASTIYFVRELTGVGIAAYLLYFLGFAVSDPGLTFTSATHFNVISYIGLGASIFHTLTWLRVTAKVTPFDLSRSVQLTLFALSLVVWLGLSFLLYTYLYG
ncbi:hypothetical protein CO046_01985 [Candidatus Peregrinibacteria bacterium CG_4_9_14_0_2_um_filter_53_11]|nr:MAG: hypothetical protein CO046_01985 [Candidatus Peregrinibacteria bacterium CG_4_9_14_0_2_um_filter_53_11]